MIDWEIIRSMLWAIAKMGLICVGVLIPVVAGALILPKVPTEDNWPQALLGFTVSFIPLYVVAFVGIYQEKVGMKK